MPRPPNDPNLLPAECRKRLVLSSLSVIRLVFGLMGPRLLPGSVSGGFRIGIGRTLVEFFFNSTVPAPKLQQPYLRRLDAPITGFIR